MSGHPTVHRGQEYVIPQSRPNPGRIRGPVREPAPAGPDPAGGTGP